MRTLPAAAPLLALLGALSPLLACGDKAPAGDSGSTDGETDSGEPAAAAVADAGPDVSGVVGETLVLDGSGSSGVAYLWDFGDGERIEEAEPVVEHAWAAAGTYTAVLQVTGEDGGRRTDSATVTITLPAAEQPPAWGAPLALDAARDVLWAVFPEAGELRRCAADLSDCTSYAVCDDPRSLAVAEDALAVACSADGAVVLLDPADGSSLGIAELGTGAWPRSVAAHPDGDFVASLSGLDAVVRIGADATELARIAVGPEPHAVAVGSDGAIYASRFRSPDDGAAVYVVRDDAWAGTLRLAVDESPDSDTTTRGVPNLLDQLALTPDGGTLLVPALHANLLRGEYRDGQALVHDQALRAVVAGVDLADAAEVDGGSERLVSDARKQLDERGRTLAVVPSPSGDRLYALHPGAEAVTVLSPTSLDVQGALLDIGHGPLGLALSPDGGTLYVHAWLSRELRAYDVTALPSPPPLLATAALGETEPLDATVLRGKQLFWTAADKRITRSGYVACAHCHPDGRDDGRVWDFTDRGEGLRNTTSLLGMGTGEVTADPDLGLATGRLHWSGNFDEAQDFEHDIRGHFAGTGLLDDEDWAGLDDPLGAEKVGASEDLDALATFMHSLSETPASPLASDTADEVGRLAFETAGCGDCHGGDAMTDSERTGEVRHDVGTRTAASGSRLGGELDGFDTPTLRGLWATAPYLHDGSAATVEEAITAHAGPDFDAGTLDSATVGVIADWLRGL